MINIDNNLLQDANFRQNLETNFELIEQNIEDGTLWNCGITSKSITIIRKNDSIIDKIVFLVRKLFGYIDTSYASMQGLKYRVKIAELTELTAKITEAQQKLEDLKQQGTLATEECIIAMEDLRTKTDQVKDATKTLNTLNAGVNAKKREMPKLEKEIEIKKNEFEALEEKFNAVTEKLKTIEKEEELEAKLQVRRIASQVVTKEIEEITEGLGAKHAELINRIGKTELGVAGWLANANQMIKEKEKTLRDHLLKDRYVKPENNFGVVLNSFRRELSHLRSQIPLIINSKQYADFLSQLQIIETTGWNDIYYNETYTVAPESQSSLHKTILREIKELAELNFTRSQMMALTH